MGLTKLLEIIGKFLIKVNSVKACVCQFCNGLYNDINVYCNWKLSEDQSSHISFSKRLPVLFSEFQTKESLHHNLQSESRAHCACFTYTDVISVFSCPFLEYQLMTIPNSA